MATYAKRGGVWRAQVRRKGVYLSETFKSKADAVAWATGKEHEIHIGAITPGTVHTVADAMREYEKRVSPTKRSARWEAIRFGAFIRDFPELADMPLADVTAEHMGRWRDARLAGDAGAKRPPVGSATVLREINLYSHVFTTARDEWKWTKESPFTGMRRPTEPQPRKRRISDDERDRVLLQLGYRHDATPKTKSARIGAMFVLALETAMRAGEIEGLRWDRLDDAGRYAHLPRTKTEIARDVPLSPKALRVIEQMRPLHNEFDGFIFGVKSEIRSALFRKATKAAMLEDLHFHDARREALTRLSKIFNVMELAKISGHRDLSILQSVYYAPHAADLADKLHHFVTT
ncbi:tyrosine-type recombinase/integrase [Paraburkholderia hayleyella]|uniref:tyrosine-type recombinase/integrase n=1 Tax=Paraburkholderia hayleyella TaxID=2152889 RepID=UPI001290E744|nr:site-specific integrase [Paraburkholderia hayleyella]